MNRSQNTLILLSFLFLSSCADYDRSDLIQYIQGIKLQQKGEIPALPEFIQSKMFSYHGDEIRDPFLPVVDIEVVTKRGYSGPSPDANRIKEPLENFSLDSLRMMGSLMQSNTTWILIKDPEGLLHRLKVGNYLGLNNGEIVALADDFSSIKINELVADGAGWKARTAGLALSEEE